MLLNKVIVGKGYKMLHDSPSMTAPPSGYDSVSRAPHLFDHSETNHRVHKVLAEVGGSLNYDELIVYTNDAVRPSYVVMYE